MIGLIHGSPKAANSASQAFIRLLAPLLPDSVTVQSIPSYRAVCGSEPPVPDSSAFETLASCEAIVLVFPLYVDAIPSHLLRFLMDFEAYCKQSGKCAARFYAIAQCGFHEGRQNRYALQILSHFCVRAGLRWCGGLGLGGGGAMAGEGIPQPFLKPYMAQVERLANAVKDGAALAGDSFADIGMPRWMYMGAANMGWVSQAKKNGLRRKDILLRAKP